MKPVERKKNMMWDFHVNLIVIYVNEAAACTSVLAS